MTTTPYFDGEEQEIVEAVERGEFVPDEDQAKRTSLWKKAAKKTLKKKPISIRLLETDIQKLKSLSYQKGLPYQTLISSVLHQFANKKLTNQSLDFSR